MLRTIYFISLVGLMLRYMLCIAVYIVTILYWRFNLLTKCMFLLDAIIMPALIAIYNGGLLVYWLWYILMRLRVQLLLAL